MRLRTRNIAYNPKYMTRFHKSAVISKDSENRYLSHSYVYNNNSTTKEIPDGESRQESILDMGTPRSHEIKYVRHEKFTCPSFDQSNLWNPGSVQYMDYGDSSHTIRFSSELSDAFSQAIDAWYGNWGNGLFHIRYPVNPNPLVQPADRQGELPARIRKHLDGWHATTFIIEANDLPRTLAMFSKRGLLMKLLTRPPWGRSLSAWKGWLRSSKDAYLGTEYGINPTIGDLRNVYDEIRKLKSRSTSFSVVLRGSKSKDFFHQNVPAGQFDGTGRLIREDSSTCRRFDGAYVTARKDAPSIDNAFLEVYRRYIGMNPAQLAWEVLPLSFIVDWFFNVSAVADNLWLRYQPYLDVRWWSTLQTDNVASLSLETRGMLAPVVYNKGEPEPARKYISTGPFVMKSRGYSYERTPRLDGPSILASLGQGGVGLHQAFNLFLISLGLRRS